MELRRWLRPKERTDMNEKTDILTEKEIVNMMADTSAGWMKRAKAAEKELAEAKATLIGYGKNPDERAVMKRTFSLEIEQKSRFWCYNGTCVLCANALATYFILPSDVDKIDIVVSDKPLIHGYRMIKFNDSCDMEVTLSDGSTISQYLLVEAREVLIGAGLDIHKPFYVAVEY